MAAALPAAALAIVPTNGPPLAILPVTINATAGDQFDPHVDGDIAAYTSNDTIRYYRFFEGTDAQVPAEPNGVDNLSDVSNGRIVFSRTQDSGRLPIMVFDTSTATTAEIDPVPTPVRTSPAIGSDTVAFIDLGLAAGGELIISVLGGATVRITSDLRIDRNPAVAPLGDVVVYESCESGEATCDIHRAGWNGSDWVVASLTSNAEPEANPATDGTVVVYEATRSGESDVYWQPVGGGAEQVVSLAGVQRNPSVSAGVVAFESVAVGDSAADLYVYEGATNRLFQVTSTPADERLNDISALGGDSFRIVWSSGAHGSRDVYGATFTLPSAVTDHTPPAVTCDVVAPGPVFVLGGAGGVVTASVTDTGSGPAATSVGAPADVSSLGSRSVLLTGRDLAGNETTIACPYQVVYGFGGFLQPVDPLPVLNVMKAGAAVPVSFSLGGDRGLSIFESGYPKSQSIPCSSTALVSGIEQTITAGGSSLQYDPASNTYTYVWKTDKAWEGTCRQLVLGFVDGTFQQANFKFK